MATIAGMSLSSPRVVAKGQNSSPQKQPDIISKKVEESIKNAEEACSGDPISGECVAAWDEVEELSAAASHARNKNSIDPLETYCGADECRIYDN
ncbi:hypothetical protein Lal_00047430 [Lupinus albus]|uniref:Uncharacterized protein n=1 Tax=Lupinus albus TaxID=3870 RepID=A0A6A5N3A3_LUPAL|nr:hypothetical protein Lalb_Chr02g0146821 [Lupinus albus]KAF1878758.1 hypothetical protein Lal_00047430 [Lupinus albus]